MTTTSSASSASNNPSKRYLLGIMQPVGESPDKEQLDRIMRDVGTFMDELKAAGAWVFNGGLHQPGTATVVRVKDGETLVTDGPYLESREFLGGFVVITAHDLDEALGWAAKAAAAITLPIEVRPFVD